MTKITLKIIGVSVLLFLLFRKVFSFVTLTKAQYIIYDNILFALYVLIVINTIITIFIFCTTNVKINNKYTLKLYNYKEFLIFIKNKLYSNGYEELKLYKNSNYVIEYFIKKKLFATNIYAFINLPELTQEVYDSYKNNNFEDFTNYLISNKIIKKNRLNFLTCILCVDKSNKIFKNFLNKKFYQDNKIYMFPIGINFNSSKVYIIERLNLFQLPQYMVLSNTFIKYIDEILIKE